MEFLINTIEADRPTINGRTYSRKAMEAAVVQAKEKIANGTCFFPVFIGSVDSSGKVSEDDLKLISFNFQFKK